MEGGFKIVQNSVGEYLGKFDLIGLLETWSSVQDMPVLKGYKLLGGCDARKNNSVKGRKSGGVAIFVRENVPFEKVSATTKGPNSVSVKAGNVVFLFVYRPPDGSVYSDKYFFDTLENNLDDIESVSGVEKVFVLGDFNCRTGRKEDYIMWDKTEGMDCGGSIARENKDVQTNQAGKELLELCKSKGMRIVNGRCNGDFNGESTFVSHLGQSTIDYVLVGENSLDTIKKFTIGSRLESSHMPLELCLETEIEKTIILPQNKEVRKTGNTLVRYKWKESEKSNALKEVEKNKDWILNKMRNTYGANEMADVIQHWMKRVFKTMKISQTNKTRKVQEANITVQAAEEDAKQALVALK